MSLATTSRVRMCAVMFLRPAAACHGTARRNAEQVHRTAEISSPPSAFGIERWGTPAVVLPVCAQLFGVEMCAMGDSIAFVPTVLRSGPYRVYFFSHEPNEPPHVHVDRDDRSAKFWLQPVALARNLGFAAHELRVVRDLIEQNRKTLLEAWHGYPGAER